MAGPVLSNVAPAGGAAITKNQVLSFDVTDVAAVLVAVVVIAHFATAKIDEVVWDGAVFGSQYTNASNTVGAIANGFSYSILRDGGWLDAVTLEIIATDAAGNQL